MASVGELSIRKGLALIIGVGGGGILSAKVDSGDTSGATPARVEVRGISVSGEPRLTVGPKLVLLRLRAGLVASFEALKYPRLPPTEVFNNLKKKRKNAEPDLYPARLCQTIDLYLVLCSRTAVEPHVHGAGRKYQRVVRLGSE